MEGLKRRDEFVFRTARERAIPVLALPAGGYAANVRDTVIIHTNTVLACAPMRLTPEPSYANERAHSDVPGPNW
jgi:acetoin utilization deacetylase AcuC-like enzyme